MSLTDEGESVLTIQKNFPGKWSSEVIYERFQIMESWLSPNKFYIYDLEIDDQIRDSGGSILYFEDAALLEKFIEQRQRSARSPAKADKTTKKRKLLK